MSPIPKGAEPPYVVLAAWHCTPCDVQGRSPDAELECWNCGGQVTVTARPVLRLEDPEPAPTTLMIPAQRSGPG